MGREAFRLFDMHVAANQRRRIWWIVVATRKGRSLGLSCLDCVYHTSKSPLGYVQIRMGLGVGVGDALPSKELSNLQAKKIQISVISSIGASIYWNED